MPYRPGCSFNGADTKSDRQLEPEGARLVGVDVFPIRPHLGAHFLARLGPLRALAPHYGQLAQHLRPCERAQVGSPSIHVKAPGPGLLQAGGAAHDGPVQKVDGAATLQGALDY